MFIVTFVCHITDMISQSMKRFPQLSRCYHLLFAIYPVILHWTVCSSLHKACSSWVLSWDFQYLSVTVSPIPLSYHGSWLKFQIQSVSCWASAVQYMIDAPNFLNPDIHNFYNNGTKSASFHNEKQFQRISVHWCRVGLWIIKSNE